MTTSLANMNPPSSHYNTLPSPSRLVRLLGFLNLRNHQLERFGDVVVVSSARLNPAAIELLAERLPFFCGHFSLLLCIDIVLVADDHDRYRVRSQVIQEFIPDNPDHIERLSRCHRIHNQVSVDANVQLRIHQTVFILSRRIDDFCEEGLALVDDLMAEGVLDRGVIAFDKVAFTILDGQGRFADRTTSKDGDLSLLDRGRHVRVCEVQGLWGSKHTSGPETTRFCRRDFLSPSTNEEKW